MFVWVKGKMAERRLEDGIVIEKEFAVMNCWTLAESRRYTLLELK